MKLSRVVDSAGSALGNCDNELSQRCGSQKGGGCTHRIPDGSTEKRPQSTGRSGMSAQISASAVCEKQKTWGNGQASARQCLFLQGVIGALNTWYSGDNKLLIVSPRGAFPTGGYPSLCSYVAAARAQSETRTDKRSPAVSL